VNVITNSKVEDLTAELLKTLLRCRAVFLGKGHSITFQKTWILLPVPHSQFSVNSSSCFSVSTFLLCFSADPQMLTVTFTSLTHSTALWNYLQDTKIEKGQITHSISSELYCDRWSYPTPQPKDWYWL